MRLVRGVGPGFGVDAALSNDTEVELALAIMCVENLQRPRWFRVLERLKGLIRREGTYGIMQVAADGPISDEESIRRAIRGKLAGVRIARTDYGNGTDSPDGEDLRRIALDYNPSAEFADAVCEAYWELISEVPGTSA